MHAQIITYQLQNISPADYQSSMVAPDAPRLANVPGLLAKTWLANPDTNTYGGVYYWESPEAMANFMASDLVSVVVARPFLTNISSVDFTVPEAPSRLTRGFHQPLAN